MAGLAALVEDDGVVPVPGIPSDDYGHLLARPAGIAAAVVRAGESAHDVRFV